MEVLLTCRVAGLQGETVEEEMKVDNVAFEALRVSLSDW